MGCIRVDKITEYLCDPLHRCLKVRRQAAVGAAFVRLRERSFGNVMLLLFADVLFPVYHPPALLTPNPTCCLCRMRTRMCARPRLCAWPSCLTSTQSWWRTAASSTCSRSGGLGRLLVVVVVAVYSCCGGIPAVVATTAALC